MAKKPITPGQKAARARDRVRFAATLADNESKADAVHERLLNGDRLERGSGGAYAFRDGHAVDPALIAILRFRKIVKPHGDLLIPCTPEDFTATTGA